MELDNNFYTRSLTRGTPQGGVLSPLIWNVNFDSMLDELNKGPIKVIGFADDAAILITVTGIDPKTMVQKIQTPIDKIVAWGAASGLAFNSSKTVAVRVGHLLYWERKLNQYSIKLPNVNDRITKTLVWECNFKVPDFESTRNDAKDVFNPFTCYTDGSQLNGHSGYGYVITKFNRTIYKGNEYR
jgi:hypothetical protein